MATGDSPKESGDRAYQWVRSNILGLVAIFIALSGSAVAAQIASQPQGQRAVKKVKRGPAGPPGLPGIPGPQGPQGPQGPSTGIGPNAVGPAEIQDPTRSISLPLGSFVGGGATLDFVPSNGTAPDFRTLSSPFRLVIEFDEDSDGGGADTGDAGPIITRFTVPPDYVSGGAMVMRVSKDVDTPAIPERLRCFTTSEAGGAGFSNATISSASLTTYTLPALGSFAAGQALMFDCSVDDGSTFATYDDNVYINSAEFRYTATQ